MCCSASLALHRCCSGSGGRSRPWCGRSSDPHDRRRRSWAVGLSGWVLVFISTFLINHFELFGLHQVANNLAGKPMPADAVQDAAAATTWCVTRSISASSSSFWATPVMTAGHLLFAAVTTAYIFVGICARGT